MAASTQPDAMYEGDEEDYEEMEADLDGDGCTDDAQDDLEDDDPLDVLEDDKSASEPWGADEFLEPHAWTEVQRILTKLEDEGITDLTIVLVGVQGSGKSHTISNLVNEPVASPMPAARRAPSPLELTLRSHRGLLLRIADSNHFVQDGAFSPANVKDFVGALGARPVSVLVYVDRLDSSRVSAIDHQMWEGISTQFGPRVWKRAMLCLTRGATRCPPGYDHAALVSRRRKQLAAAMRQHRIPDLPCVVVENATAQGRAARQLPDGSDWLLPFIEEVVETALDAGPPERLRPRVQNPNRRGLWRLPLLIAAQFALKLLVLDPLLESDGWRGDKTGEYDEETQREERLILQEKKRAAAEEAKQDRKIRAYHS